VETDKEECPIDLKFNFDSPDRTTHYGLHGRASNVFPVENVALSQLAKKCLGRNNTDKLVTKLYWTEESRQSEAGILEAVHKIAVKAP